MAAAARRPTVTDASVVLGYLDPAYLRRRRGRSSIPRSRAQRSSDASRGRWACRWRTRRSASIAWSTRRWPKASASCRSAAASIRAASRWCPRRRRAAACDRAGRRARASAASSSRAIPACCRRRACSPRRSSTRSRRRSRARSPASTSPMCARCCANSTPACGALMARGERRRHAGIDPAIPPMSATSASRITSRCRSTLDAADPLAALYQRFPRGCTIVSTATRRNAGGDRQPARRAPRRRQRPICDDGEYRPLDADATQAPRAIRVAGARWRVGRAIYDRAALPAGDDVRRPRHRRAGRHHHSGRAGLAAAAVWTNWQPAAGRRG